MTREEAIERLRACPTCTRWITTPDCDGCFVDRMPPTPEQAIALLQRAVRLGLEAEKLRGQLRGLLA